MSTSFSTFLHIARIVFSLAKNRDIYWCMSNIHNKKRVLFVCKQRPACYGESYGLLNSCRFLCNALNSMGVEAKTVEVLDNNSIDAVVTAYNPTHVFIEALWVVPSKFDELIPLHKQRRWYVRLHSNVPFIANEGVAIDWIRKYMGLQLRYKQFNLACNSDRMQNDLYKTYWVNPTYTPNIYRPSEPAPSPIIKPNGVPLLDIGCFGAIRPLKNQLIQAMAAITFADNLGKILRFHINYTRVETHGENVYRNLIALFADSRHQLVTHPWIEHPEFLALVATMDLGMQVSFSETFNIVAADFVYVNIPVIGSTEIEWMDDDYQAKTTDFNNIVKHLMKAWEGRRHDHQRVNKEGLAKSNRDAKEVWEHLLKF